MLDSQKHAAKFCSINNIYKLFAAIMVDSQQMQGYGVASIMWNAIMADSSQKMQIICVASIIWNAMMVDGQKHAYYLYSINYMESHHAGEPKDAHYYVDKLFAGTMVNSQKRCPKFV